MHAEISVDAKTTKVIDNMDVELGGLLVGSSAKYKIAFVGRVRDKLHQIEVTMSEKEFRDFVDQLARHRSELKEKLR